MAIVSAPLAGRTFRGGRMANQKGGLKGDTARHRDIGYELRREMGEYLQNLRQRKGLTQADVALSLGMFPTAISAIELGRNSLPPERYAAVADLYGVSRKALGKVLLRYYNPWLFGMLYPGELPEEAIEQLPERLYDHRESGC